MPVTLLTGPVVARSGVTVLARIRGQNGQLITQSSISTITVTVSDLTAGSTGSPTSLTVSSVVFNSLQTDARWTKDSATNPGEDGSAGYNFLYTVDDASFPLSTLDSTATDPVPAQKRFQIDFVFTPVSGEPWRLPVIVVPQRVYA